MINRGLGGEREGYGGGFMEGRRIDVINRG